MEVHRFEFLKLFLILQTLKFLVWKKEIYQLINMLTLLVLSANKYVNVAKFLRTFHPISINLLELHRILTSSAYGNASNIPGIPGSLSRWTLMIGFPKLSIPRAEGRLASSCTAAALRQPSARKPRNTNCCLVRNPECSRSVAYLFEHRRRAALPPRSFEHTWSTSPSEFQCLLK